MTSTPASPDHDGTDLAALRSEIDALKAIPEDELLSPVPSFAEDDEPTPAPTDAIGSEQWDTPAEDESLDQQ
ncbi:hypothetical protein LG299_03885 [Microbacterium lacus]|uniref:hypothetical protein n=1 Tax=Microbacterium lacus TaxID=415217 RepID=UPI00384ADA3C